MGPDSVQYQASARRFVSFPTDEFVLEPFPYGHIRRNTIKGGDKTESSWTIGMPLIFPNMNVTSYGARFTMIWRTPTDDENTMSWFLHGVYPGPKEDVEVPVQTDIETVEVPMYDERGMLNDYVTAVQDHMAFFAQGRIVDRTKERLGYSDRDIVVWRRTLQDQLDLAERGGEPMNVFRDPRAASYVKVPLICRDDPNRFGKYSLNADGKYQKRSTTANYSIPDLPIVELMETYAQKGAEAALEKRRKANESAKA
jgi:hypothetical protein